MKNRRPAIAPVLLLLPSLPLLVLAGWQIALPNYHYQFPRDHFEHNDYQTEWWYYTGNLESRTGNRYGFELTFFRAGQQPPDSQDKTADPAWKIDPLYLAHLALTDIDNHRFVHVERVNRAGPGLAGASLASRTIWNGNWHAHWTDLKAGTQELQAICDQFSMSLHLTPEKPPVIHNSWDAQNHLHDVSQKGPNPGDSSHYISFTRVSTAGTLHPTGLSSPAIAVTGTTWMDHEFFTAHRGSDIGGWDWFSIQLDNGEDLMLYRLRTKSGKPNGFSSGTFVARNGSTKTLRESDFELQGAQPWVSPQSKGSYPLAWTISVPSLDLKLNETPALKGQELFSPHTLTPPYWEGAVIFAGTEHQKPVRGRGYLEMTGYKDAVFFAPR